MSPASSCRQSLPAYQCPTTGKHSCTQILDNRSSDNSKLQPVRCNTSLALHLTCWILRAPAGKWQCKTYLGTMLLSTKQGYLPDASSDLSILRCADSSPGSATKRSFKMSHHAANTHICGSTTPLHSLTRTARHHLPTTCFRPIDP